MTSCREHLLSILRVSREDVIRECTDIAITPSEVPLARSDIEQMLRACVALLEEGLSGDSTEVRTLFLEALPDVARTTTWQATLRDGLPCWGVIIGKLVAATSEAHRDEAIVLLSRFMGAWWVDASNVMLPVFIAEKTL